MEMMNLVGIVACNEGDNREMGDFVLWGAKMDLGFLEREREREREWMSESSAAIKSNSDY